MLDYFVLPCWPMPGNHDRLRQVQNDFAGLPDTYIVEPQHVFNFLFEVSDIEINAVASAILYEGDPLVEAARRSLIGRSPADQLLILKVLVAEVTGISLSLGDLQADTELATANALTGTINIPSIGELPDGTLLPDDLRTRGASTYPAAADLDLLDDVVTLDDDGRLSIILDGLEALAALAYEARARYDYSAAQMVAHLSIVVDFRSTNAEREPMAEELAWAVYVSELDPTQQVEVLTKLLVANFDTAAQCEGEVWEDVEDLTWSDLASNLLHLWEQRDPSWKRGRSAYVE
jgi:hypothetical protein